MQLSVKIILLTFNKHLPQVMFYFKFAKFGMFATPLGIELKTIAINFMYKQEISAATSMRNEKLNFSKMKFS